MSISTTYHAALGKMADAAFSVFESMVDGYDMQLTIGRESILHVLRDYQEPVNYLLLRGGRRNPNVPKTGVFVNNEKTAKTRDEVFEHLKNSEPEWDLFDNDVEYERKCAKFERAVGEGLVEWGMDDEISDIDAFLGPDFDEGFVDAGFKYCTCHDSMNFGYFTLDIRKIKGTKGISTEKCTMGNEDLKDLIDEVLRIKRLMEALESFENAVNEAKASV